MDLLAARTALGTRFRAGRAAARGCAIALTYHRVTDAVADPHLISVSPENFSAQIRAISETYPTMSAGDLLGRMARRERLPRRCVVITLDDGYSDVLSTAVPILAENGVPATAFLCSDQVGGDQEYWWDELERVVLSPGDLPAHIAIPIPGAEPFEWDLQSDRSWSDADAQAHRSWSVTQPPARERHRVFLALSAYLRPLSRSRRRDALDALREQCSVPLAVRPDHRQLSVAEARELDNADGIELGAHTMSHQLLSARTPEEQQAEIVGCKTALEELLSHPVSSMSYPHGGQGEFSADSERIAREAGFEGAMSTEFGIVVPWADRYAVRRCHTENIDGDALLGLLGGWFDAAR